MEKQSFYIGQLWPDCGNIALAISGLGSTGLMGATNEGYNL